MTLTACDINAISPKYLQLVTELFTFILLMLPATMHDLGPLDPAFVAETLSKPPFVTIPGVINVRDLGSYPSITSPGLITRPGHVYRSAEISAITSEGMRPVLWYEYPETY